MTLNPRIASHHLSTLARCTIALALAVPNGALAQEDEGGESPPVRPAARAGPIGTLKLHFVTTRNQYAPVAYDVFDAMSREVVASGAGALPSKGEEAKALRLPAGLYKIVRAGQPFTTTVDFATAAVQANEVLDYVVMVDPITRQFRGSGPATTELPEGVDLAGIRLGLTAGGSMSVTDKRRVVGTTNGTHALFDVFANFSMVYDKDNHFVSVISDAHLSLDNPATASIAPIGNRFEGQALYSYKVDNPYLGPYARGSFRTKVFRDYLYLEGDPGDSRGEINVAYADGGDVDFDFGEGANADDLRFEVSQPFAPFIIQEGIGANLKALDLDLLLLDVVVATRVGYGIRHGIMNGLLAVQGSDKGSEIALREVSNYTTHGPVVGATASASFARWLFGNAQLGVMIPLKDKAAAGDGFGNRILFDFSGTAGLRTPMLTSLLYGSLDYTFRIQKDGYVTSKVQREQTVMARVNITLL